MSIDSEPTAAINELLCQHAADAVYAHTGRRTFFEYRETGLKEATQGKYRSQIMRATDVMEQTGWHYHVCDLQFVYVIKGWVDLEFEGGRRERVGAGDVMAIPSGMIHNEIAVSPDFEALEVVAPAEMDTVPVPAP
jgi:quercetin dioxygenase-like cupin family protein